MIPILDIVLVNWNAGGQLKDCLRSIVASSMDGFELGRVVVVDNASNDGSMEGVERIPLPLQQVQNEVNRGFAAACNQGAEGSGADYILFLNPDMVLFRDSLSKPVNFLANPDYAEIGIVGIQLLDEDGEVSLSCVRFPTAGGIIARMFGLDRIFPRWFPGHFMTDWDHAASREVDQVMGAFFLVRRSLFEELGGFDERFFVYFEELDFSLRARARGLGSFYLAAAQARHIGCGTSDQVRAKRLFYSLRSRILYGFKHFGTGTAVLLAFATLVAEPAVRMLRGMVRCSGKELGETARGAFLLWMTVPSLLLHAARKRVK